MTSNNDYVENELGRGVALPKISQDNYLKLRAQAKDCLCFCHVAVAAGKQKENTLLYLEKISEFLRLNPFRDIDTAREELIEKVSNG